MLEYNLSSNSCLTTLIPSLLSLSRSHIACEIQRNEYYVYLIIMYYLLHICKIASKYSVQEFVGYAIWSWMDRKLSWMIWYLLCVAIYELAIQQAFAQSIPYILSTWNTFLTFVKYLTGKTELKCGVRSLWCNSWCEWEMDWTLIRVHFTDIHTYSLCTYRCYLNVRL